MLMQVAFCDFLSGLLGRGMRGSLQASKKGGVKCYLWLDPLHYIPIVIYISSRGVIRIAPWPPNLPTTTTTLLIFDAVATAAPLHSPRSTHLPSSLCGRGVTSDLWPWLGPKQRSDSGTRALCVRDDEEGHLICRSGDVLQERCTHCHYYYSSTPIS